MSDNKNNEVRVCANCQYSTSEDDLYCRECGSLFSAGKFDPDRNEAQIATMYGPPPVKRQYSCKCGFSWITFSMLEDQKYCPKCGNECPGKRADL